MKTLSQILDTLRDHDFKVRKYYENGELCGYEVEGWTDDIGINMLHFIDCRCRAEGVTAKNVAEELIDIVAGFDLQEETINHLNAYEDLRYFGLRRILDDMENYEARLTDAAREAVDMKEV